MTLQPAAHTGAPGVSPAVGRREAAFLVVGAVNAAVGFGLFAVLFHTAGDVLGYLGSLVVAYAIAILVAFVLHRTFVFKVRGQWHVDLMRFTLVQAVSFGLNVLFLTIFVELAGLPVLVAQVISMVLVVAFAYFGHLLFSFRRTTGAGIPA